MIRDEPKLVSWVLDRQREWCDAVVHDDLIVGQTVDGGLAGWRATPNGEISSLWRHENTEAPAPLSIGPDRSIIVGTDEGIAAFAASTGESLWRTPLADEPRAITLGDDRIWVARGNGISLLNAQGEVLVEQELDMEARWMSARASTVDAWSEDEYICLSRPTSDQPSSIMWLARNPLGIQVDFVAIGRDFAVLRRVGGKTIRLFHQFDSAWGQSVDGPGRLGDPGVDEEGSRVFSTLTTGEVIAWTATSGDMLWHSPTSSESEEFHPPPAPFLVRNKLIASTRSGIIRIFHADSGTPLGETKTGEQRKLMPISGDRFLSLGSALRVYGLRGQDQSTTS